MSSGLFSVLKVSICKYLVGLASWVEEIIEEANASTQDKLLTDFKREPFTTFACYALEVPEYRLLYCTVLYTNTIHSTLPSTAKMLLLFHSGTKPFHSS